MGYAGHRLRSVASIAFDWTLSALPMQLGGTPAPVCYGGKDNMKDRKLSIRISEKDLQTLHHKADKAKLSITDYCIDTLIIKLIS